MTHIAKKIKIISCLFLILFLNVISCQDKFEINSVNAFKSVTENNQDNPEYSEQELMQFLIDTMPSELLETMPSFDNPEICELLNALMIEKAAICMNYEKAGQ